MAEDINKNDGKDYEALAKEYLVNWQRERADFLNYKKDEARKLGEFIKFANGSLVLELLEVIDDLELATNYSNNKGVDNVLKKFQDLLSGYGVERMNMEGKFDPELHEALETEEGGNKIVEVRAGYKMHGKVIRPTRVKIIK